MEWLEQRAAQKSLRERLQKYKYYYGNDTDVTTTRKPYKPHLDSSANEVIPESEVDGSHRITDFTSGDTIRSTKASTFIVATSTESLLESSSISTVPSTTTTTTEYPQTTSISYTEESNAIPELTSSTTVAPAYPITRSTTTTTTATPTIKLPIITSSVAPIAQKPLRKTQRGKGRRRKPHRRFRGKKPLRTAIWGPWSTWSHCSRSCGGGVMSQSRQCLQR